LIDARRDWHGLAINGFWTDVAIPYGRRVWLGSL